MNVSDRQAMKDKQSRDHEESETSEITTPPPKAPGAKAAWVQPTGRLPRISSPRNGEITEPSSELILLKSKYPDSSIPRRKLVIHFDIRNTVLVADSVTNVNVEQALNSYLTCVSWGSVVPKSGEWRWYSDTPSLTPPAPKTVTYYKHLERKLVKTPEDRHKLRYTTGDFTHSGIGKVFQPYFDKHIKLLRWTHKAETETIKHLTMKGKDKALYHYILPSFFKLLFHLANSERDFAIIFRTYGLDASNVLLSTEYAVNGRHPQFDERLDISVNKTPGAIHRSAKDGISLEVRSGSSNSQTYRNERDIYDKLSKVEGVSAFKDDFLYWQNHGYNYTAGKPLWIDPDDTSTHHIIFDDNIRTYEDDNIVDLRMLQGGVASSLKKEEIAKYEDVFMVQSDLMASIEYEDYFINKVAICEQNYSKLLRKDASNASKCLYT